MKKNKKEKEREIRIKVTDIFYRNFNSQKQIIVNIGGTRSSKTWSILLVFLVRFIKYGFSGLRFLICRKSTPSLRKTVKKSFEDILEMIGCKEQIVENKQMMEYKYLNSTIMFSGLDEASKIKTGEFNYIFMEEADEFSYDDFRILQMRLSRINNIGINQIFLAFNPSDINSWIKKYLIDPQRDDVEIIHSTYKDNPFFNTNETLPLDGYKQLATEHGYRSILAGIYASCNFSDGGLSGLCGAIRQCVDEITTYLENNAKSGLYGKQFQNVKLEMTTVPVPAANVNNKNIVSGLSSGYTSLFNNFDPFITPDSGISTYVPLANSVLWSVVCDYGSTKTPLAVDCSTLNEQF
jgi:hypothetical protein